MSGSDPAIRAEILTSLECCAYGTLRASTVAGLRDELAPDASVSQFDKALGSLAYNRDGGLPVLWKRVTSRERPYTEGVRDHLVTLRRG